MNQDDRLSRYLTDQAEGLALPPADAAGVMRRGSRRRTRRRAGFVGGLAVVGLLGATLAVRDPGSDQQVAVASAPNVTASSYDWDTVVPSSGLGYGDLTAQLADGSVYGISTAPGAYDPERPEDSLGSTLYRTSDGTEWAPVSLPDGVRTADLAGVGDTLYSVGTAPAGGMVLSASRDGASSWTSTALPDDVRDLKERHGDRIVLGSVSIAAADASHVVIAAIASTSTDLTGYRPEFSGDAHAWRWDEAGVTVYELEEVDCDAPGAIGEQAVQVAEGPDAARAGDTVCRTAPSDPMAPPGTEVARFTHEELGIVGELRDHLGGRAHVYATDDGTTFARADLPSATGSPGEEFYAATALATADGYRLVLGSGGLSGSSTTVLRSADGHSWTPGGTLAGSPSGVGLLAGRPALGIWDDRGYSTIRVEQADGEWAEVDLAGAVSAPEGFETWVGPVSFGPLGLAAVVQSNEPDGDGLVEHIVHSRDGSVLEVLPVADVVEGGGLSGLIVTADAVVVRFTHVGDDPGTPPTQTVVVGTPTA